MNRSITRTLTALAATAAATLTLAAPAGAAVKPCPTEDATGCHWSAQTQGNGHGRSFTTYRHHRTVYGPAALTLRQVRHVEHVVHHLPYCASLPVEEQDAAQNCRNRLPHQTANASFASHGHVFYVETRRGALSYAERY